MLSTTLLTIAVTIQTTIVVKILTNFDFLILKISSQLLRYLLALQSNILLCRLLLYLLQQLYC